MNTATTIKSMKLPQGIDDRFDTKTNLESFVLAVFSKVKLLSRK